MIKDRDQVEEFSSGVSFSYTIHSGCVVEEEFFVVMNETSSTPWFRGFVHQLLGKRKRRFGAERLYMTAWSW